MGSLTIRSASSPAMREASLVAWRCASLKYAGTVMTALCTGSPKWASACCFSVRRISADTSGGVTSRSPTRIRTTSSLGAISKGTWRASSLTSSPPRPMKRLTE